MKRIDLLREIRRLTRGLDVTLREGGGHTKVLINGKLVTTVPRHREVNEHTAREVVKDVVTELEQ